MSGPLLSLFTPTHNPKYLPDAYDSLKRQDYTNWEWVLIPNGEKPVEIPEAIRKDPRVRIGTDPKTSKIGALKLHACNAAKGDAFIEFDHDDLLVPGTLKKVASAIDGGAGFVFSDVAVFNNGKLESWAYHPSHGWDSYDLNVYGRPYKVTRCFDITPRSLCEVYYAPDHVRVWSRDAYYKAGGHDAKMAVGDDHDLICRTYLSGAPFKHIGSCGYLYRFHEKNTIHSRQKGIVDQTAQNRMKYTRSLAIEWAKRNGLGTAEILPLVRDKSWTFDQPLPFDDNSMGMIAAWDILQFCPPELQARVFNEVYRCLAPAGILCVAVPSEKGLYATMDPRHVTRFNQNSFLYYSNQAFARNNPEIKCRFQVIQRYETFPDAHFKEFDMRLLVADLCALKGQRQPGPQHI
jgi:glycosyltransferase involved in cell wall biosynthesis